MENKIKGPKIKKESNLIKENKKYQEKKESEKQTKKKIHFQKIRGKKINKNIITSIDKKKLFYIVLVIIDIIITIYFARKNAANYVKINEEHTIFVGDTKNLIFGRNYISLITTIFFFIYTCLANRILFREKTTKKFIITTFIFYFILNIILFLLFTKRIY